MYRYNFPHRKEKRRQEAEERNAASAKMTPHQKLEHLNIGNISAKRQRARLQLLIDKQSISK